MNNFVNGLFIYNPRPGTPDFIKADIVIDCKLFTDWMRQNYKTVEIKGQQVNQVKLQIKVSKEGKLYVQLNDYQPNQSNQPQSHQFGQGKTYNEVYGKTPQTTQTAPHTPPVATHEAFGGEEVDVDLSKIPF